MHFGRAEDLSFQICLCGHQTINIVIQQTYVRHLKYLECVGQKRPKFTWNFSVTERKNEKNELGNQLGSSNITPSQTLLPVQIEMEQQRNRVIFPPPASDRREGGHLEETAAEVFVSHQCCGQMSGLCKLPSCCKYKSASGEKKREFIFTLLRNTW